MPTQERKPFPFLIGSDPEYTYLYNETKLDASNVHSIFVGSNSHSVKGGKLGHDGCPGTAELRPRPAKTADEHADNIGDIFTKFYPKLKRFDLLTLSLHAPIGGHIHLDMTPKHKELGGDIVKSYLFPFLFPIWLSEDKISRDVRGGTTYGKLFSFKIGDAPTEVPTLEVRGPSAEWITSHEAATAVLGYLGTVWNEMMVNPEVFKTKLKDICYCGNEANESLIKHENTFYTNAALRQLKDVIKTFEFYKEYKKEIDLVLNPEKYKKLKASYEYNIWYGWGLKKRTKVQKRAFFSKDAKIDDKIKKTVDEVQFEDEGDADDEVYALKKHQSISGNGDRNIDVLVDEFTRRIYASGLKLQHEFFIFGLRKAIQEPIVFNDKGEIIQGREMIQTEDDFNSFGKTFTKMSERARTNFRNIIFRIDPKKGVTPSKPNVLYIGVPYGWRTNPIKIDHFLNLIWPYTQKEVTGTRITLNDVKKEKGGIFAEQSKDRKRVLKIRDVADRGSQGMVYANAAINTLIENKIKTEEKEFIQHLTSTYEGRDLPEKWFNYVKQNLQKFEFTFKEPAENHIKKLIAYDISPKPFGHIYAEEHRVLAFDYHEVLVKQQLLNHSKEAGTIARVNTDQFPSINSFTPFEFDVGLSVPTPILSELYNKRGASDSNILKTGEPYILLILLPLSELERGGNSNYSLVPVTSESPKEEIPIFSPSFIDEDHDEDDDEEEEEEEEIRIEL